jgi:hypothetical protein
VPEILNVRKSLFPASERRGHGLEDHVTVEILLRAIVLSCNQWDDRIRQDSQTGVFMQFQKMKPFVVCLCVLVYSAFAGASVLRLVAHDALIGKWKATVTPDDGGKDSTDNLTFKGGQFTSENEKGDGFDPATYDDDPSPQGISAKFTVTLTNKAGDSAKWTGVSTGAEMDGTLVITKKDGSTKSYSFKASKG